MNKKPYTSPAIERSATIDRKSIYCKHALTPDTCAVCAALVDACAEILVLRPQLVPGSAR